MLPRTLFGEDAADSERLLDLRDVRQASVFERISEARPAINVSSVIFRHIIIKNLDMADYTRPLFRHKLSKTQAMADYESLSSSPSRWFDVLIQAKHVFRIVFRL
jgi:hypothetical protein